MNKFKIKENIIKSNNFIKIENSGIIVIKGVGFSNNYGDLSKPIKPYLLLCFSEYFINPWFTVWQRGDSIILDNINNTFATREEAEENFQKILKKYNPEYLSYLSR